MNDPRESSNPRGPEANPPREPSDRPSPDPIWSRWRQRHRRAGEGPLTGPSPAESEGEFPPDPAPPPRPEPEPSPAPDPEPPPRPEPEPEPEPPVGGYHTLRDAAGETLRRLAEHRDDQQCVDLCPICRTADVLRATAPPELRAQWHELQREALVTMRAVLDHYIERLERRPGGPTRVEDIPID